jgi:hypothetical protein
MSDLPVSTIGYDMYFPEIISAYFTAGNKEKGISLAKDLSSYYFERTAYFLSQRPILASYAEQDVAQGLQSVSQVVQACYDNGEKDLAEELNNKLKELYNRYLSISIKQ